MAFRTDPGVPILEQKIEEMISFYFPEPTLHFPSTIFVGVPSGLNPMDHRGGLKNLSPAEYVYALIIKIARDITNGKEEDTLRRWPGHSHTESIVSQFFLGRVFQDPNQKNDCLSAAGESQNRAGVECQGLGRQ